MKKTLNIDSAATLKTALTVTLAGALACCVVGCGQEEVAVQEPECQEVVVLGLDEAREIFAERAEAQVEARVDRELAERELAATATGGAVSASATESKRGVVAARASESGAVVKDEVEREEEPRELHSELEIVDDAIATGVVKREPVGVAAHFGDDARMLWAWVQVRNLKHPSQVTMVWRHEGKERSRVTLDVGVSPRWRTWSRKSIGVKDHGEWTVEVISPDGETLRTMSFDVSPAQGSAAAAAKSSPV